MRRIIIIVCAAALAACAYAKVGSVISSFYIGKTTEPTSHFQCIYRDPSYVYAMFEYCSEYYINVYKPSGGKVAWRKVLTSYPYLEYFGSTTGCHLGAPYLAFSATENYFPWRIYTVSTNNGSVVQSFLAEGPGGSNPYDIMWDGLYYNVHSGKGVYNRYTRAGAQAGRWTVAGWPAGLSAGASTFSRCFNNASGRYLFMVSGRDDLHYVFNMNDGSLLASWGAVTEYCYGQSYGDAYPRSYGGALWYHGYIWQENDAHWAYQIDVDARGAALVLPASLGKVKAIYR